MLSVVSKRESPLARYVVVAFVCVFTFLALVGNSLVIIAVKKNIGGHMNTRNSYFILNLSVADFVMSVRTFLIFAISTDLYEGLLGMNWKIQGVLAKVSCRLFFFSLITLSFVSICWILVISIDRACAILFPLKTLITKTVTRVIVVLAWTLPCAYASPAFYFYDIISIEGQTICTIADDVSEVILYSRICYIFHAIVLLVTFLTLATLYTAIIVKLWFKKIPGQQNTAAQQCRKKMNRKVLAMLVSLQLAFYVCNLPIWLHEMSVLFSNSSNCNSVLMNTSYITVAVFLTESHGCINPCIIMIFIQSFRTAVRILIRKMFPCRKCISAVPVSGSFDIRMAVANGNDASIQAAGMENPQVQLESYRVSEHNIQDRAKTDASYDI